MFSVFRFNMVSLFNKAFLVVICVYSMLPLRSNCQEYTAALNLNISDSISDSRITNYTKDRSYSTNTTSSEEMQSNGKENIMKKLPSRTTTAGPFWIASTRSNLWILPFNSYLHPTKLNQITQQSEEKSSQNQIGLLVVLIMILLVIISIGCICCNCQDNIGRILKIKHQSSIDTRKVWIIHLNGKTGYNYSDTKNINHNFHQQELSK